MKAFKLINTENDDCSFLEGEIPESVRIDIAYFFAATQIEKYQLSAHPAPRYQLVVTLKGRLKFTVTNGDSFIIEPGVLLIAGDLEGKGHSWELLEGTEWQRLYLVLPNDGDDGFIKS